MITEEQIERLMAQSRKGYRIGHDSEVCEVRTDDLRALLAEWEELQAAAKLHEYGHLATIAAKNKELAEQEHALAEERGREIERLKAEKGELAAALDRCRSGREDLFQKAARLSKDWQQAEARLAKVILMLEDYAQDGGNPVLLEHALATAQQKEEKP